MNTKKVSKHISNWIKEYADNASIENLVVGVSGGIDSSVVSTLCAMTGINTILVEMPINMKNHVSQARKHIEYLKSKYDNIQHEVVVLTNAFNIMDTLLAPKFKDNPNYELSLANTASRLRMMTLYSFSNCYKGLVVGTGNKVEDFGVGFFTIGGDGQVDISPIADLMKSEVYELGAYLGVDQEILKASPTDGLWNDGRTDESQIGASYDELEWAMTFVEDNWYNETGMENGGFLDYNLKTDSRIMSEENLLLSDRQREVLKIYLDRHNANKHKMQSIPICYVANDMKN